MWSCLVNTSAFLNKTHGKIKILQRWKITAKWKIKEHFCVFLLTGHLSYYNGLARQWFKVEMYLFKSWFRYLRLFILRANQYRKSIKTWTQHRTIWNLKTKQEKIAINFKYQIILQRVRSSIEVSLKFFQFQYFLTRLLWRPRCLGSTKVV